jgi:NodT family efflux transporter outer membrane factor (OMF) lipoprotein
MFDRPKISRLPLSIAAAALSGAVLSGCTVGPNYVRPDAKLPEHWSQRALQPPSQATPASGELPIPSGESLPPLSTLSQQADALASWWQGFRDPKLEALIARSLDGSLDLRVAVLRSTEALAQSDVSRSALWPSLSANASYARERLSESVPAGAIIGNISKVSIPGIGHVNIPNPYNQYQLGASASWELDLFGRLRRTIEAANAAAQVSLEDQRAVQVSLLAQVGQSYVSLRAAQARKAVTLEDIATLTDLLTLTRQRYDAGLATEVDVRNASAQLSQTRAQLPALEQQISAAIHTLSILVGSEPESLRAELEQPAAIPPVPPVVPVGLPAELARRRPDIRQAEASLHAATAQIGVAIGALFPRLTLSAAGGFQSVTPGGLLQWNSLFGNVGPALEIPIFDRGNWKTVTLYRLKAQEAALSYQAAVLTALHEVEDAADAYNADQQQRQWLTDTVAQNREVLELARQRYESGVSDFLNVLDAQRTLQQNQLTLLASTAATSSDLVSLYRALGGGWSEQPQVP